jgi:hypothetical protein
VCFLIASSLFISVNVANKFYDLSYDGQGYHQDTIIFLSQGWNPVYEKLTPESTPNLPRWKWLNSYPKASEELGTIIYKATGKIEQAKGLNFMFSFMAFGFVLSFLWRIQSFNKIISLFIAILLIWNPVHVTQLFSFYLDGQLYLTLLSLISVLGMIYITHKNYLLLPLVALLTVAWNLKLTGVLYSTFFVGAFLVLSWYSEKILLFFKKIQAYCIMLILAVVVIGFNPFITNLLQFHDPFYLPTEQNYLVSVNIPENYLEKNSIERFILSIFSKSDNIKGVGTNAELKVPFTYSVNEVDTFIHPDNNEGGFGPLFGAVFLVSIFTIISISFSKEYSRKQKMVFYFLLITIFISSILIPPSSYARYIPQFWIFPVVACLYAISDRNMLSKFFGVMLLVLMVTNNLLITQKYFDYNYQTSRQLSGDLNQLRVMSEKSPLEVSFGVFRQNKVRFTEAGIDFKENDTLPCEESHQKRVLIHEVPESIIQICN